MKKRILALLIFSVLFSLFALIYAIANDSHIRQHLAQQQPSAGFQASSWAPCDATATARLMFYEPDTYMKIIDLDTLGIRLVPSEIADRPGYFMWVPASEKDIHLLWSFVEDQAAKLTNNGWHVVNGLNLFRTYGIHATADHDWPALVYLEGKNSELAKMTSCPELNMTVGLRYRFWLDEQAPDKTVSFDISEVKDDMLVFALKKDDAVLQQYEMTTDEFANLMRTGKK